MFPYSLSYIFHLPVIQTTQPYTVDPHTHYWQHPRGRNECFNPLDWMGEWQSLRQLKDWTSCGGVGKTQVAGFLGQHLPLEWQWWVCSVAYRCTSLPLLLLCLTALGGIIALTGHFPCLVCIQREREDENQSQEMFSALQLDGKIVCLCMCACVICKQRKGAVLQI